MYNFQMIMMTKLLYILPCFLVPYFTGLSKQSTYLRVKQQLFNSVIDSDTNDKRVKTATIENPSLATSSSSSSSSSSWSPSYTPEAIADQITNLPGLDFTPTFEQFSGYLDVSPTRKIHYWFIQSMNDPSNDPLVFWTNGGPGCSGFLGLGTEFGPYIFNAGGNLTLNPFTWNKVANILYVEQPAGVGFSTFSSDDDKYVGDDRAAVDNYELIKQFFERFPEMKSNDFYIASESYGGHYIPHLAKTIIENKNDDDSIQNFKGFLVGNPYVDPFSNDVTMIQTYYMHGLIPGPLFVYWEENCIDPNNYDESLCDTLVNAIFQDAGSGINPYAVDFPACTEPDNNDYPPKVNGDDESPNVIFGDGVVRRLSSRGGRTSRMFPSSQSSYLVSETSVKSPPFLPKDDVYHPCAEAHLYLYLNRGDVKEALHVETDKEWSMCTDDIKYSEDDKNEPQMELYEWLISYGKQNGSDLKMMVLSGDDDSICSTASTQAWIWDIGAQPIIEKMWKPWKVENQTAGYFTEFDLGEDTNSTFIFVTVHGAGHEVPAYRPAEALVMFQSFFSGEWELGR